MSEIRKTIDHETERQLVPLGPLDRSENVTALGYVDPKTGHYHRILGLSGPCNDAFVIMDTPGEALHMYKGSYLSRVDLSDSVHHINEDATVDCLMVSGTAIVHINGTVHTLQVTHDAQVYLHGSAVVNSIEMHGNSFIKAEFGSTIHKLVMKYESKAFLSIGAIVDTKQLQDTAKIAHFYDVPETEIPHIRVRIKLHRVDVKHFCTVLTDQFNKYGYYAFGNHVIFTGIFGCHVYGLYDNERDIEQERYAVEFCAKTASRIDDKLQESLKHPGVYYYDNAVVYMWIDGVPLSDWLETHQEPLPDPQEGETLCQYALRVSPGVKDIPMRVLDNWQKHQSKEQPSIDDDDDRIGPPGFRD